MPKTGKDGMICVTLKWRRESSSVLKRKKRRDEKEGKGDTLPAKAKPKHPLSVSSAKERLEDQETLGGTSALIKARDKHLLNASIASGHLDGQEI